MITFTTEGKQQLGLLTSAHIRTGSLLGERVSRWSPKAKGTLRSTDVIPDVEDVVASFPTDAVSELTTNTAGTDTRRQPVAGHLAATIGIRWP